MRPGAQGLAAALAVSVAGVIFLSSAAPAAPPAQLPAPLVSPAVAAPTAALLQTGISAFRRGDYAEARRIFRPLAERDIAAAETLLGTMAANGQGGPKDDTVAAAWFLRAARRNYAPAQLALADAFARGRGVKKDPERAVTLARAAAIQGQPGASQFVARNIPQQYALLGPIRHR